jgi:hypothetical protein
MRLLHVLSIGVIFGLLAVVGFCSEERRDRDLRVPPPATSPDPPPPARVTVTVTPLIDASMPDAPISALHLPAHDVDATKVLYSTLGEVRQVLGAGTPRNHGRWRYKLGDEEFLDVVYDHGKAFGIEMPTTTPGWDRLDAGQRFAIRAWGHLGDSDVPVRGHHVTTGDSLGEPGLALYDQDYWKRETAKIDAENARIEAAAKAKDEAEQRAANAKAEREERAAAQRAKLGRVAREGFVEQFAAMAASSGRQLGFNLELGEPDTTLRVVGPCNGPILRLIVDTAGDHIRNVEFTRVECASNSSMWVTP